MGFVDNWCYTWLGIRSHNFPCVVVTHRHFMEEQRVKLDVKRLAGGNYAYYVLRGEQILTHGYRPEEREARSAGMEDLKLCRDFRIGLLPA